MRELLFELKLINQRLSNLEKQVYQNRKDIALVNRRISHTREQGKRNHKVLNKRIILLDRKTDINARNDRSANMYGSNSNCHDNSFKSSSQGIKYRENALVESNAELQAAEGEKHSYRCIDQSILFDNDL